MKRLLGLLAILGIVQSAGAASTFDSLLVRPALITIVEDPRFPKYARVEVDLVWLSCRKADIYWELGNDSGYHYFEPPDTILLRTYLWGDDVDGKSLKNGLNLHLLAKLLNSETTNGKFRVLDPTVEEAEVKIDLNWAVAVHRDSVFAEDFCFQGAYPNPFGNVAQTTLTISVPVSVQVLLYNKTDILIDTLLQKNHCAGVFHFPWDSIPSGVYFMKLYVEGNLIDTKKVVLIR